MNADFELMLATTRSRLSKFTRPMFERDVVEALIEELGRRAVPTAEADDWDAVGNDDVENDDDEVIADLMDRIERLNRQLTEQYRTVAHLEAAYTALQQQAHVLATQIQWMIAAEPDELNARLRYLRGMKERLGIDDGMKERLFDD